MAFGKPTLAARLAPKTYLYAMLSDLAKGGGSCVVVSSTIAEKARSSTPDIRAAKAVMLEDAASLVLDESPWWKNGISDEDNSCRDQCSLLRLM